jgi:acyl-CoA thioesterase-1
MGLKALALHFTVITALSFTGFSAAAQGSAQAQTVQIVGFGDSLMAGYQLPPNESYTAQLEVALKAKGVDVTITNAGVSGDTTSGGLSRIDWSVPDGTQGVIVELGANDALRGISPEQSEKNLDAMLARLKERKIPVVLAGMLAPPNMGGEYAERFNPIYKKLAEKYDVPLYPFFLDGVVAQQSLQLEDGMHPNAQGVKVMVERSLPVMQDFVRSILMEKK